MDLVYPSGKILDQRADSENEVSQDADGWLLGFQQGGLVKKYLAGELGVAFRRAEPAAGQSIQDSFVIFRSIVDVPHRVQDRNVERRYCLFEDQQATVFT